MPSETKRSVGLPPPRASLPSSFRAADLSSIRKLVGGSRQQNFGSSSKLGTCLSRTQQQQQLEKQQQQQQQQSVAPGASVKERPEKPLPVLPSDICPCCLMPFDKNRKRRLIDSCGHERCYSCLFSNEICPLCSPGHPPKKVGGGTGQGPLLRSRTLGSSHELNVGSVVGGPGTATTAAPSLGKGAQRSSIKTNGHFSPYMQIRSENLNDGDYSSVKVTGLPPASQSRASLTSVVSPFNRRKGVPSSPVLSPRVTRNAWTQRHASRSRSSKSPSSSHEERTGGKSPESASSEIYRRLALRKSERSPSASRTHNTSSSNSYSSLGSLDPKAVASSAAASSNNSPVSTLTGSSENEATRAVHDASSDSMGSSLSMSLGGRSTSASPRPRCPSPRRHSITSKDLDVFAKRQSIVRRSARSGTVIGPIDPKIRFAQFRPALLSLKPLFFEVPQQEAEPLFCGRSWLFRDMASQLLCDRPDQPSARGVVLSGLTGSGKTAAILQLVDYSCFGRKRHEGDGIYEALGRTGALPDGVQALASRLVAYHFCQADNSPTCLVADFVHSVAAQLCQAPQLLAYRQLLLSDPHLQNLLSMKECIADPHASFVQGVLEPLASLKRAGGQIGHSPCIIVVDGICEAEYHRPDYGDTLGAFLARHALHVPPWLKIVVTVRTALQDVTRLLPYARISLDPSPSNDASNKDLLDYISYRVNNSPSIRSNVTIAGVKSTDGGLSLLSRFAQHLCGLSRGSFLHTKLTLDLIERGHLVMKSSSYKVLPVSLCELFLLNFNLRFASLRAYERVQPILCVCLAALNPMTLLEMYHSVNALQVDDPITWEDFVQRLKILNGLVVKRSDETHMLFHPSFREWLLRREEGESNKFLCDPRTGHAAIAFRLSRLEAPLDGDKTLELGHHILKAHLYKTCGQQLAVPPRDLQAIWVSLSSDDVSSALGALRNVYSPNVKVSRLLMLAGASPDHVTELRGNSPLLCVCAQEGFTDMVSLLIEFGVNVDATNNNGTSALALAAERGHCDIVRLLVQSGARLGVPDHAGLSPLVYAAQQGFLNVVGYLLSCDWPSEPAAEELGLAEAAQQALIVAAAERHVQVVEFLLDMAEVRVNLPDSLHGETAMTSAATAGQVEMCRILLRRGASVAVTNLKDVPPLICAVQEGHWEVAECLLKEAGASVEQTDGAGRTPLMVAAAEGHVGVVELLISKGAAINKADKEGITALGWACLNGHRHAVLVLLDKGAEVNYVDKLGRTPLDLAATCSDSAIVQILLEKGAILEHVDLHGMRPLDRAISCRNTPAVQAFLRRGAKLGPATWALAAGKHEIMLILLGKLLDDGNTLSKKQRLKESALRYQYALKKFPPVEDYGGPEHRPAFEQLRIHLMLNLSRCKRKLGELEESIKTATEILQLKPDSYEALYARSKAYRDLGRVEDALSDLRVAIKLSPSGRDARKILLKAKDEMQQLGVSLGVSLDTLSDHDMSSGLGSSLASERV